MQTAMDRIHTGMCTRAFAAWTLMAVASGHPACAADSQPALAVPADPVLPKAVLDTVVTMHTDAGTFRLHYGYLAGRPPLDVVQRTEKWHHFTFAFWMPSGRYLNEDGVFTPRGRRPAKPRFRRRRASTKFWCNTCSRSARATWACRRPKG